MPECNCEEMAEEDDRNWTCPLHGRMWFNNLTGEIEKDEDESPA